MVKQSAKRIKSNNASTLQRALNQRDRELRILLEDINDKFDVLIESQQSLSLQFTEFRNVWQRYQ